ncbi:D-alanine--D-alanine ligase [Helicobacter ailurogastricus]|uniref:D-alanine--D-alanine ligase n=1 Tax=Helicobacter ailurogastricus TaxID=1578720 RepID=UPI00244D829D|nr:D-alanine--D-alanine ligase [Helicobacter ailurogastricus]GMB89809.1 D-alanine--D-alanine ligase [Helicobacter ailurogastricus]
MDYGLLFGGKSFEHEISIVSAIALKEVLREQIKVFIFLDGAHKFYLIEPKDMRSQLFSSGQYKKCPELSLKMHGFYTQGLLGSKKVIFNTLINLIHGADGEDGKLASLLDFFGVRFIGPRVEASVLSFNKHFTKMLAKEKGLNTLPYVFLEHHDGTALKHMNYPLIAKPNRLGSSIGIRVIQEERDIAFGLDEVFEFDSQVLIEPFKKGVKEYNLAGCKIQDKGESAFVFSTIEEPQKKDFLGFEEKYLDFARTDKVSKADLSPALEKKMHALFKALYDPLFVGAIIRCDFFVIEGEVFLNEINPIPGSLAHYLFEDFAHVLAHIDLPKPTPIPITYNYINQIQKAK